MKIQRLTDTACVPTYGSAGAAAFDLYASDGAYVPSGGSAIVDTGLAVEVPTGHVMLIFSRSGHGFNFDVRLSNCVGVIDSDYRGEVKVKLASDRLRSERGFDVLRGDRIAQAMVIPVERQSFEVVQDLSTTLRSKGGFGSTGA